MGQRQVRIDGAKQDGAKTVARIEANPGFPHRCFACEHRRDFAKSRFELRIAGVELVAPERVEQVDEAKQQDHGRARCNEGRCKGGHCYEPMALALRVRLGRDRELLRDAKVTDNEFVDFQPSDSSPANGQPTNG